MDFKFFLYLLLGCCIACNATADLDPINLDQPVDPRSRTTESNTSTSNASTSSSNTSSSNSSTTNTSTSNTSTSNTSTSNTSSSNTSTSNTSSSNTSTSNTSSSNTSTSNTSSSNTSSSNTSTSNTSSSNTSSPDPEPFTCDTGEACELNGEEVWCQNYNVDCKISAVAFRQNIDPESICEQTCLKLNECQLEYNIEECTETCARSASLGSAFCTLFGGSTGWQICSDEEQARITNECLRNELPDDQQRCLDAFIPKQVQLQTGCDGQPPLLQIAACFRRGGITQEKAECISETEGGCADLEQECNFNRLDRCEDICLRDLEHQCLPYISISDCLNLCDDPSQPNTEPFECMQRLDTLEDRTGYCVSGAFCAAGDIDVGWPWRGGVVGESLSEALCTQACMSLNSEDLCGPREEVFDNCTQSCVNQGSLNDLICLSNSGNCDQFLQECVSYFDSARQICDLACSNLEFTSCIDPAKTPACVSACLASQNQPDEGTWECIANNFQDTCSDLITSCEWDFDALRPKCVNKCRLRFACGIESFNTCVNGCDESMDHQCYQNINGNTAPICEQVRGCSN